MTTNRLTNRTALMYAIEHLPSDTPTDIREKLNGMVAALDKKNGGERKPTATQIANASLRADLVAFIREYAGKDGFTATDIIQKCPAAAGMNPQKVSPLLNQAVDMKEISKKTIKRRSHFVAYDSALDTEEEEG